MKSLSSLVFLLASIGVLAQTSSDTSTSVQPTMPEQIKHFHIQQKDLMVLTSASQKCPIVFTAAKLDRPAEYMPVATSAQEKSKANLHLSFSNPGGKQIAAMALTGYLKVKPNRYALDATEIQMPLTFTPATDEIGSEADIPLLRNIVGFDHLTLDSVTYKDGSVWHSPKEHHSCSFTSGSAQRVAK